MVKEMISCNEMYMYTHTNMRERVHPITVPHTHNNRGRHYYMVDDSKCNQTVTVVQASEGGQEVTYNNNVQ